MSGDRLSLAVRVIKARRTSTCSSCRGPILRGMYIARLISPAEWIHRDCVPHVRAVLESARSDHH